MDEDKPEEQGEADGEELFATVVLDDVHPVWIAVKTKLVAVVGFDSVTEFVRTRKSS